MKIIKFGHCCFVAEPKIGVKVMTDPGTFSTMQNEAENISVVVVTHEHADHLHIESLKKVLENNPNAVVITNSAVGKILRNENIEFKLIEEGNSIEVKGVMIKGFGNTHAEIYGTYGQVQNTGYMIDLLCFPGDAFEAPGVKVDILALPVAGPWMRIKDAIDYEKNITPRIIFPVHDAILSSVAMNFVPKMAEHFLSESGIDFKSLELGKEEEI